MIEAYPLYWPEGRPRTPEHLREESKFDTSFARARDEVVRQAELMTGRYDWEKRAAQLIVSTNVPLRQDGLPLANYRRPTDTGVAVYFNYQKRPVCFACDRWNRIEDNMQAIAKTIDALRGIARWGTGDMMEAAFKGFAALPAPPGRSWWVVLGVARTASRAEIDAAYLAKRSAAHPDRGGTAEAFDEVQRAYEEAAR